MNINHELFCARGAALHGRTVEALERIRKVRKYATDVGYAANHRPPFLVEASEVELLPYRIGAQMAVLNGDAAEKRAAKYFSLASTLSPVEAEIWKEGARLERIAASDFLRQADEYAARIGWELSGADISRIVAKDKAYHDWLRNGCTPSQLHIQKEF